MNKRRLAALSLIAVLALALLLTGCDKREDTRKYVQTIGVVFTNDLDNAFRELYVYSGTVHDMGEDFIKNKNGIRRVGSYGVTLEVSESYNVWLKDWDGGAYEFEEVALANGDMAVISYDEALTLTITHQGGGTDVVEGSYVPPGDAPEQPQSDLRREESFKFNVQNDTGEAIVHISMREAANQAKGEVELHLEAVDPGKMVSISQKLDEVDTEIEDWVLQITTGNGKVYVSEDPFYPWDTEEITLTLEDGKLILDVTAKQ